jgi:uncharacterized protein
MLGSRIRAETLIRFGTMLARPQSVRFNASKLGAALDVASSTISRYLDLMVDLVLVRRLQPWAGHVKKRLVKTPRVYVRDTGVVHAFWISLTTINCWDIPSTAKVGKVL